MESSPSAVLGRDDIINGREKGELVIEPFVASNVTNCAYEITLSPEAVFIPNYETVSAFIDVSSKPSVRSAWKLLTADDTVNPVTNSRAGGIMIAPKGIVIVASHEFVGTKAGSSTTTLLRARSTLSRSGVSVSSSAGWGDIGFYSRWGLVLVNTGCLDVFIPFGTRVAQIVFLRVSSSPCQDKGEEDYAKLSGTYALGEKTKEISFGALSDVWTPEHLLPR